MEGSGLIELPDKQTFCPIIHSALGLDAFRPFWRFKSSELTEKRAQTFHVIPARHCRDESKNVLCLFFLSPSSAVGVCTIRCSATATPVSQHLSALTSKHLIIHPLQKPAGAAGGEGGGSVLNLLIMPLQRLFGGGTQLRDI